MARFSVQFIGGPQDGFIFDMPRSPQHGETYCVDVLRSNMRHVYVYVWEEQRFVYIRSLPVDAAKREGVRADWVNIVTNT